MEIILMVMIKFYKIYKFDLFFYLNIKHKDN